MARKSPTTPKYEPDAIYDVEFARPAKLGAHTFLPRLNPHELRGRLLIKIEESEPDAIASAKRR